MPIIETMVNDEYGVTHITNSVSDLLVFARQKTSKWLYGFL